MATIRNLYIDQGSDYSVTITVEGMNLTGYDVLAQFRKSYGSNVAYDFEGEVTEASDEQSKVTLVYLGEDSAEIEAGRFVYDAKVVSPGGTPKRIVEGLVILSPQATRPAP